MRRLRCGAVGLKPTFGRVSKHGALTLSWSLDHAGPPAWSSHHAALLLRAIASFDPQDPSSADIEVFHHLSALTGDLIKLRIGVPGGIFSNTVRRLFWPRSNSPSRRLGRLGATVGDCELPDPEDTH